MMLQQTQVDRVIPFYERFLKTFPTAKRLAAAPLSEVIKLWSGLGYNRRAKFLHEASKAIGGHSVSTVWTVEELEQLPGVGPYTARAVAAFAYDRPEVVIETNIRAALIHHLFPTREKVDDKELVPLLEELVKTAASPREWYGAFMDYGAYIKRTHPNPSRRSKHHVKQSKFEGSLRQVRGTLLKELAQGPLTVATMVKKFPYTKERISDALLGLGKDGLVERKGSRWQITHSQ
jgi:A/G-specific adenine glycosylase